MYDVIYLDGAHRSKLIASGLDKGTACDLAREEARRRGVGRMFLAGSDAEMTGEVVVIVHTAATATAA